MFNTGRLNKCIVALFFLFTVYLVALLIGPRQPDDTERKLCQVNVYLKKPFGITMDCDAPDFLKGANDLRELLHPRAVRQSRPGLIFLAKFVSDIVRPLTNILMEHMNPTSPIRGSLKFEKTAMADMPAPFLSYAILNFLFLCAAFLLAKQVITNRKIVFSAACALLMLAFNDVIKVYFYSPHTQIFNIFLPVLLVWTVQKIRNDDFFKTFHMYSLMVCSGYGLICYGTFILVPIVAVATEIFRRKFVNSNLTVTSEDIKRVIIFAVLFSLPMLLWSAYVISLNGKIFFYEAETCDQFTWILAVYHEKGILGIITRWLNNFYSVLRCGDRFIPVTLALLAVSFGFLKKKSLTINLQLRNLAVTCFLVAFLFATFFSFQGISVYRLSIVIFIPVWIWIAALNQYIEENLVNIGMYKKVFFSLVLVQCVYTVLNTHCCGG